MQVTKKSMYRQRVYQDIGGNITLIFGEDTAPLNTDGSPQKILADHDIVDIATVTDHLNPSL